MVNRSLGNLLRSLTKPHGQSWDSVLPQAEFAYNDLVNRSTGKSPFQIFYGMNPRDVLELRELPKEVICSEQGENFFEAIKDVHEQVKTILQKTIDKYKEHADKKRREVHFQVGDMVWVHLKKEWIPKGRHTRLMMRLIGPCTILKAFGSNAYEVKLP